MTMYYSRENDSALGNQFKVSAAIYIFRNADRLEFAGQMHGRAKHKLKPFTISKVSWVMRCLAGFCINMLARNFIGSSVPILLMRFHDPINCVIYAIAVHFIVTMDDSAPTTYSVHEKDRSMEGGHG